MAIVWPNDRTVKTLAGKEYGNERQNRSDEVLANAKCMSTGQSSTICS